MLAAGSRVIFYKYRIVTIFSTLLSSPIRLKGSSKAQHTPSPAIMTSWYFIHQPLGSVNTAFFFKAWRLRFEWLEVRQTYQGPVWPGLAWRGGGGVKLIEALASSETNPVTGIGARAPTLKEVKAKPELEVEAQRILLNIGFRDFSLFSTGSLDAACRKRNTHKYPALNAFSSMWDD
ncbi:uncharacterized protein LAJ45_04870 [Morchella importuna]|uniref:uncharacterized protein n=1 Tax=Morchella importuna TaxID=1174673 RepID=UPI001E8D7B9A|nr:uncharacterized protein LAJ45_04870 [Morchella importuna]KAH8151168.1 hypothetical protein LAJ45_04870 [Morchella importuna]